MEEELVVYLREVAAMMEEHPATELTLRWDECRLTLKRPVSSKPPVTARVEEAEPAPEDDQVPLDEEVEPGPAREAIQAHLVGVFHAHGDQENEPLIQIGTRVHAGSVVGFIESMRVMNEVICPLNGEVMELHVEHGQPVEFGQELITLTMGTAAVPAEE